jgi:hypothetical protein
LLASLDRRLAELAIEISRLEDARAAVQARTLVAAVTAAADQQDATPTPDVV